MGSKILRCAVCTPHAYQDAKYGWLMRVHNLSHKHKGKANCTVCGRQADCA